MDAILHWKIFDIILGIKDKVIKKRFKESLIDWINNQGMTGDSKWIYLFFDANMTIRDEDSKQSELGYFVIKLKEKNIYDDFLSYIGLNNIKDLCDVNYGRRENSTS